MMATYVCFDIGGTTVKHALVSDDGKISKKGAFKTKDDADYLLKKLETTVQRYQKTLDIAGIGVSTPGIVRRDGYLLTGGANHDFDGYPLAEKLTAACHLPVAIENDGNAAAIAERWLGSAIDCDNYLMVVLGTGVGAGIVINGEIYRGAHGMAGEFGWNVIHDIDPTRELESFSLNQHAATVSGLVDRYNASRQQVDADALEETSAKTILAAAQKHEPIAEQAVQDFIQDITIMLLNLFSTFDPEKILIGGGISSNPVFVRLLQQSLDTYISRHESLNRIRDIALGQVQPAKLRNNAGLIGAAYQIKQQLQNLKGA